jgi:hypothetical protein
VTIGDDLRVSEPMQAPIRKVGLVALREVASDDPLICLTQVLAKNLAEQDQVDFGLPKGTRRYFDPKSKSWHDIKDDETALRYRDSLEDIDQTLVREAHEEVGILPESMLHIQQPIRHLGVRPFESRKGQHQNVDWYVIEAPDRMIRAMEVCPKDAYEVRWVRQSKLHVMAKAGEINPSYAAVADEAISKVKSRQLTAADFGAVQPTR